MERRWRFVQFATCANSRAVMVHTGAVLGGDGSTISFTFGCVSRIAQSASVAPCQIWTVSPWTTTGARGETCAPITPTDMPSAAATPAPHLSLKLIRVIEKWSLAPENIL